MGGRSGRWVYHPLSCPARLWNAGVCISGPKAIAPVRQQLRDFPGSCRSSLPSFLGALPSSLASFTFIKLFSSAPLEYQLCPPKTLNYMLLLFRLAERPHSPPSLSIVSVRPFSRAERLGVRTILLCPVQWPLGARGDRVPEMCFV